MANASLNRLKLRLARVPREVRIAAMKVALDEATKLAASIAAKAPRGDGTLVASVRVEGNRSGSRWYVKAGGKATTRPVRKGQTSTYDYALAQELGVVGQKPQPFFYKTVRTRKPAVRKAIREAALDAAKKTVSSG